jgi:hypothetical protein
MSVRSALSAAVLGVAAVAAVTPAAPAAAAGPQAPCETEHFLYQQGFTIRGAKVQSCVDKPPNQQPSTVQRLTLSGSWITVGMVVGNEWVVHCAYPGSAPYRLKNAPGVTLTGTCY